MHAFDLSPLFRSSVGFERLNQMIDAAMASADDSGFPPYDIAVTGEDAYRITMAVAGFAADDLTVTQQEGTLVVRGQRRAEPDGARYLHRGIAGRAFERRFQLADFVRVTAARLENGLLTVELVRELPERMRPRTIPIGNAGGTGAPTTIESRRTAAA